MTVNININIDNEVYFTIATSNSRADKYRTVVEKHIKQQCIMQNIDYVGRVELRVSWALFGNNFMPIQ